MQKDWILSIIVFLVVFGIGYGLRQLIFKLFQNWAKKTSTKLDDIIIEALKFPFLLWVVLAGISISIRTTGLPEKITFFLDKTMLVIWVISLSIVASKISTGIINVYSSRVESTLPVTSLTQNIANIVIFIIGFLVILNLLGISITPILTALGVGGLAVALALQETLSNLFAGIHIIMARQIRVGDYIQLDSGQEGYVLDIGWRSTRIKTLPNNIVIIPNSKLAQAIVINYYMPEKELAVLIQVGVHYDSDLEKAEKVTVEVAKEVMKSVPGGVPEFEPFIRYHTFGDSSINFNVVLKVKEFADRHLITHEFIKRLKKRYDKEGIVIPFPIRTVYMAESGSSVKLKKT